VFIFCVSVCSSVYLVCCCTKGTNYIIIITVWFSTGLFIFLVGVAGRRCGPRPRLSWRYGSIALACMLSDCLCAGHNREPYKNGWTDQDAVLGKSFFVTADLAESNGSLPSGLLLMSPAGWLPRTGISSGTLRSVIEYGLPFTPYLTCRGVVNNQIKKGLLLSLPVKSFF